MRIERIRIDAFGRLSGFDSGEAPLPRLVVVLGPNEAGKSTIFQFLTTVLYGFKPASRDANPFVPWGTDEAGGCCSVRLADGGRAEIARRLRSSPTGHVTIGGHITDVRNREVQWVEHVPRSVFRQVFAVTLGELASLDDDTWGRIQDRVVGSMGASDLRPVRAVAEELEREAGELWRPNRRGNQKVRMIRDRMRALRGRRGEAIERDRSLRELVHEREAVREELRARREEREHDTLVLDRIGALAPVRAQLMRIAALREAAGPPRRFEALPADPVARLDQLEAERDRLEGRLRSLRMERTEPTTALAAKDAAVERVLEHRDEITRFLGSASAVASDQERMREVAAELDELEGRLDRATGELLGLAWSAAPRDEVLAVSPPEVRDAVDRLERARAACARAEAAEGLPGAGPATTSWSVAAAVLAAAGLLMIGWGASAETLAWILPGALLALGGGVVLASAVRRGRVRRRTALRERDHARAESDAATDELGSLLAAVPLRRRHLDQPGAGLVADLERIQELADEQGRKRRVYEEAGARVAAAERAAAALVDRIEGRSAASTRTVSTGSPGAAPVAAPRIPTSADAGGISGVAGMLTDRLRRAEQVESDARAATRELTRLDRDEKDVCARLDAVRMDLRRLQEAAAAFPGAGTAERLRAAAACLRDHERALRLEEELERAHPDLDALRRRVAEAERCGASWTLADHDLAGRRARIQELSEQIEALVSRAQAIDGLVERSADQETADAVDGEIATLDEEARALVRERDRRWVLAQLLREADRRFREEHQPDLVRRAGTYLAHLTAGRYDRLLIEETGAGDLFRIAGPAAAGPIPLRHPVSTGTLEQAYLSLRLAMVDHLDHGPEALPLFIDEVFVNWDRERRVRGLEVLARIAEARQLFVFTCHPEVADELQAWGAGVVRLERDA